MMKFLSILLLAGSLTLSSRAEAPPLETPPAPPIRAIEAVKLGDDYVVKKFPQFPTLYCSDVTYETSALRPEPTVVWRLRYVIPNNPRKEVPDSVFPDWGVCLVYVHKDKTVTHFTPPKRNPPLEPAPVERPGS